MREYLSNPETPGRVARAADAIEVAREITAMGEPKILPVPGYPGYFISDHGDVFSQEGSPICIYCGEPMLNGVAKRLYCGRKCRQLDAYYRKTGRQAERPEGAFRLMKPMPGEKGHQRVMLYRNGETTRELIHRLVLTAFDRPPREGEQTCHRDGNPMNNALPNLRWGSQSDNWEDRKRHGTFRSHSKLVPSVVEAIRDRAHGGESAKSIAPDYNISYTQVGNIIAGRQWVTQAGVKWPLDNLWAGTSIEDQKTADERIPLLAQIPAHVRWVSFEPLLEKIIVSEQFLDKIDWFVVGAETGPHARPMEEDWARSLRKQAVWAGEGDSAGIPFFMKQMSGRVPIPDDLMIREFPYGPDKIKGGKMEKLRAIREI